MFRSAASLMPAFLRRAGLAAMACSALALVGCGGGNRAKDYNPDSIVIFGDENSAFESETFLTPDSPPVSYTVYGLVHSVNAILIPSSTVKVCTGDSTATTVCATNILSSTAPIVSVSNFVATAPDYPQGTAYRKDLAAGDFNSLYFIALGTGDVYTNGSQSSSGTAMKRSFNVIYDCTANRTWMQLLAHSFSKGFRNASDLNSGCPADREGAVSYATPNAKIAEVQTQVSSHIGSLGKGVLVGVWAGQNDILEVWSSSAWSGQGAKLDEVKRRADRLAGIIKQILNTGAKVVLIGQPDLGFSPFGQAQTGDKAGCTWISGSRTDGSARPACHTELQQLILAFNETLMLGDKPLGLDGLQDYASQGRKLAFVDGRVQSQIYALSASYINDGRVCETDPASGKNTMFAPSGHDVTTSGDYPAPSTAKYCSDLSLLSGGSAYTHIWADDRHLSAPVHGAIGSAAFNQAANQF